MNEKIIENYKVAPYTEQETIITYDADIKRGISTQMYRHTLESGRA